MAKFFIDRPIFAWVISLFIMVLGVVSIVQLPVAQYPRVAPPAIVVNVVYPGASAQTLEDSVLSVIERQMFGAADMLYMEATAQSNGTGSLTLSFAPGTDPALAQVDVQNRLSQATPRLPAAVNQQGVTVTRASSNFLMYISLASDRPDMNSITLGDYAARNVVPEIQRLAGVGQATLYGTERAMRVWVDPAKLVGYNLSTADVNAAIQTQNAQVAAGTIGDTPNVPGQSIFATVVVRGQLSDPEQFGNIVLRANPDGSTVRLKDVARVELGAQSYGISSRLNGKPNAGIGVQLTATGNALEVSKLVKQKMEALQPYFPEGVSYSVPYDSSRFVEISIEGVVHTLLEAIVLVFLVMFLFLQDWRYTLIPSIAVPVALLGTFGALLALGFSINVLTMFGMVLVIGIVVDDAIVVVENVERIMSEEGLPPLQATRKAMGQISGAIIGVTVVLISVFVPLAFFKGAVGNIYRQFSVVMVVSIGFSAFMALSLTPALCATLLKPVQAGHAHHKTGFFGRFFSAFNRGFSTTAKRYERGVAFVLKRAGRMLIIYLVILGAAAFMYKKLPTSFLPSEDQGYLLASVQLAQGATVERTTQVMQKLEAYVLQQPEVEYITGILGFSAFAGQGQNVGFAFVNLKSWDQRTGPGQDAASLAQRITQAMSGIERDAIVFSVNPPPIPELGNATGFSMRLQDRNGQGHDALIAARNQLLGMAMQSKVLARVYPEGLEDAPQLQIDIDRERAMALGVAFNTINATLSTALGSSYVNDFPSQTRMQRVVVQAEAAQRMQPEDILQLRVPNQKGQLVPISAFGNVRWIEGAMQTVRYNGYSAIKISGNAAPGYSTGDAMAEMERLVQQLPDGFGYEWTGQSFQEKQAGSQAMIVYGFSILAVFLCLAALYESWTIPMSVILVVPLGVFGVLLATLLRHFSNDVYFQVGLITIIGLSAKNAILIVEFAKDLQAEGRSIMESALEAAHLRFRPIIMTSLAFGLGVVPLFLSTGAGSAGQRAIGTGVLGGVISGTVLAVIFVPVFYVVVRTLFKSKSKNTPPPAPPGSPEVVAVQGQHHE